MVEKVKGKYYLNRAEVIDYLSHAYHLKWCLTRWSGQNVSVSFEAVNCSRNVIKGSCLFLDKKTSLDCPKRFGFGMMKIYG